MGCSQMLLHSNQHRFYPEYSNYHSPLVQSTTAYNQSHTKYSILPVHNKKHTTCDNPQALLAHSSGCSEHHTDSEHPCKCSMQIVRFSKCFLHCAAPTVGIRLSALTQVTFDPKVSFNLMQVNWSHLYTTCLPPESHAPETTERALSHCTYLST